MCGRYYLELKPELEDTMAGSKLGERMAFHLARPLTSAGEIRPGNIVPVCAPDRNGNPAVFPMFWGFSPAEGKGRLLINARVETAALKASFKESWNRCRCAVPMSWYYEWQHSVRPDGRKVTGDRFRIRPREEGPCYLAGIYRLERKADLQYPVFAVLTKEPSAGIAFIHDRMPVIFPEKQIALWLDPGGDPMEISGHALSEMTAEKDPGGPE